MQYDILLDAAWLPVESWLAGEVFRGGLSGSEGYGDAVMLRSRLLSCSMIIPASCSVIACGTLTLRGGDPGFQGRAWWWEGPWVCARDVCVSTPVCSHLCGSCVSLQELLE